MFWMMLQRRADPAAAAALSSRSLSNLNQAATSGVGEDLTMATTVNSKIVFVTAVMLPLRGLKHYYKI